MLSSNTYANKINNNKPVLHGFGLNHMQKKILSWKGCWKLKKLSEDMRFAFDKCAVKCNEMQTGLFRIWTWLIEFISYGNNCYAYCSNNTDYFSKHKITTPWHRNTYTHSADLE